MTPGPTAPATVPPRPEGLNARGAIMANWALNLLEQAAQLYGGSRSEEGAEILTAVLKLRKRFGSASHDLTQQEVKLAGARATPIQTPTPQQSGAWQQMVRDRIGSMGGGPSPAPAAAGTPT
jgi:hypothetical protein